MGICGLTRSLCGRTPSLPFALKPAAFAELSGMDDTVSDAESGAGLWLFLPRLPLQKLERIVQKGVALIPMLRAGRNSRPDPLRPKRVSKFKTKKTTKKDRALGHSQRKWAPSMLGRDLEA